jgi:phosphoribosylformylglycinamidine synthase
VTSVTDNPALYAEPTDDVLRRVGLARDEYERFCQELGRRPTIVEMGICGAMWSEHCGYKSSRIYLKNFPTKSPRVLQGPGENAGIVAVDESVALVFKMESHNHPSAVEPFQGAATGVGGIIRDIFAMGARPIALMDSLRFGALDPARDGKRTLDKFDPVKRTPYLFRGVVAGIAFYGNCIGIPTVGGEVCFDESYTTNPLVNVMCLGTIDPKRIILGTAKGVGNSVLLVGAKTGRDGIQGATFASVNLAEDVYADRPAVQVGDPFMEKLLLEATLEIARLPGLVGVQDFGAAGLTSSSSEMANKGGVGIEIDLDRVPLRAKDLSAYEIMLSESQERMLVVVEPGKESAFMDVFKKWGLDAVKVGATIEDKVLRCRHKGDVVAEIPTGILVENAPVYHRPVAETDEPHRALGADEIRFEVEKVAAADGVALGKDDWESAALSQTSTGALNLLFDRVLAHPNVASKRIVYQQYDFMVRTNTVVSPGDGDAAVLRLKGTDKAIAITTDGNGRLCRLDPLRGGECAVLEAARNVLAVGARPVAVTNCLNFGNPEHPDVMRDFARVTEGMTAALGAIGVPVISGNVSFYNQTQNYAVFPTPVIGMVGVIGDVERIIPNRFVQPKDKVFLIGEGTGTLDASIFAWDVLGLRGGEVAENDLVYFARLKDFILEAAEGGLITALHDVSDGGLAVCLTEMSLAGIGCAVEPDARDGSLMGLIAALFSEAGHRFVAETRLGHVSPLRELAEKRGVPVTEIGETASNALVVSYNGQELMSRQTRDLASIYERGLVECLS